MYIQYNWLNMDLTNTTDGITDLPTSRDNWKTSAAERRPKGPLDSKVTLKNKSLIRNNCGNNREDRDTIDTSRSSSRSQISTSVLRIIAVANGGWKWNLSFSACKRRGSVLNWGTGWERGTYISLYVWGRMKISGRSDLGLGYYRQHKAALTLLHAFRFTHWHALWRANTGGARDSVHGSAWACGVGEKVRGMACQKFWNIQKCFTRVHAWFAT